MDFFAQIISHMFHKLDKKQSEALPLPWQVLFVKCYEKGDSYRGCSMHLVLSRSKLMKMKHSTKYAETDYSNVNFMNFT